MLTISQLIQELSKYPPDMPVMVDGYEAGYKAVVSENIYPHEVIYDPKEEYYGDYQTPRSGQSNELLHIIVVARKGKGEFY